MPPRVEQSGQPVQTPSRFGEAVEQVDEQGGVERPEIGSQVAGVPDLEPDAASVNFGRHPGLARSGQQALLGPSVRQLAIRAQTVRRGDEAVRIIDSHHLSAYPGQLKAGAPHRAAQVEGACVFRQAGGRDALRHHPHGEIQAASRSEGVRQHLLRPAVVKQQILSQQAIRLVGICLHQPFSRSWR